MSSFPATGAVPEWRRCNHDLQNCCSVGSVKQVLLLKNTQGVESMVRKFHGNVRGEVRVNFLALSASKPHAFMCFALKLSGIVRANVRLNIAIPMLLSEVSKRGRGWRTEGVGARKSVLPAVFWLFYGDPLGTLFGCVFSVGHLAPL